MIMMVSCLAPVSVSARHSWRLLQNVLQIQLSNQVYFPLIIMSFMYGDLHDYYSNFSFILGKMDMFTDALNMQHYQQKGIYSQLLLLALIMDKMGIMTIMRIDIVYLQIKHINCTFLRTSYMQNPISGIRGMSVISYVKQALKTLVFHVKFLISVDIEQLVYLYIQIQQFMNRM